MVDKRRGGARMVVQFVVAMVLLGCASSLAQRGPQPAAQSTTKAESFLSPLERGVLEEMNRARSSPAGYAAVLRSYRQYYRGRLLELPGMVPLLTQEGVKALDGAVRALQAARAVAPLQASRGMSLAARDHVTDIGPRGATSHMGRDGKDPFARLSRHGAWQQSAGENIQYGGRSAREVVVQLLVDDGVPSRGHRKNILSRDYRVTGVACGKHAALRTVCVIDFAGGYVER